MSQLTLPGLARKRRDLRAEANIPVATAHAAAAAHLTDDRDSAPSFDDLPDPVTKPLGYADITTANEPAEQPRPKAYPGVAIDTMAWLREQDIEGMATVAARAAEWLRAQEADDKQQSAPAAAMRTVDPARIEPRRVETPVADLCAAAGLLYAKRHTTGLVGVAR